jgi:hypothetical protein
MHKSAVRRKASKVDRTGRGKGTNKPVGNLPPAGPPTHSEDGVDLTLIRWMLSLSPAERLQVLQENVGAILRLRREETKLSLPTSDTAKKRD